MKNEEIHQRVTRSVAELQGSLMAGRSEELERYLATMAKFPSYSWHNVILIATQRPDATRVAGFRAWRRLGRWVRAGERGIAIRAPVRMHRREDPDPEEDVRWFRAVHVFDIAQTDGQSLPDLPVASGDPGAAVQHLLAFASARGITVSFEDLGGPAGLSSGGRVCEQRALSPGETCSVLVHELAHELLHRDAVPDRPARRVRETEAEAVAFVVCQALGLSSLAASRDYIALYQGDAALLTRCLARIQRAALEILHALEEAMPLAVVGGAQANAA